MKQTVVTLKIDFVGNRAEAINKALRMIHREMDRGSILGGTISEVGNTYDIKIVPSSAATDAETKDGNSPIRLHSITNANGGKEK